MFLGRNTEISFLNKKFIDQTGQLIVVYGRRRIGKTEMLKEFCMDKEHVFFSCLETNDADQLKAFSNRVLKQNMPMSKYIQEFISWEQAFDSISEFPSSGKKLLVIDEFPYMAKNNESISSILQNLWDEKLKDENIMIILCGSSMSFIENELLAEKNPLYGRATGILKLQEMGFYDAIQFFPAYSSQEKMCAYAVLGGIPHYLKQFSDRYPVEQNIKDNILTRGSILYSEVEFLMHQELRETTFYNSIIQAVALGNTKLNDICTKTTIDKSKASVYIKNLISLELLQREFSIDTGIKERANTQRGLYKIADNFFSFWYRFVFPNMSELESSDVDGVYTYEIKPEMQQFISYKFEDVCMQFVRKQNIEETLPFRFEKLGRFWEKNIEIDIMAISKDKKSILLGECKYTQAPFDIHDYNTLVHKFTPINEETHLYYYLFSKSGFTKEISALESNTVHLFDLDTIVSGK